MTPPKVADSDVLSAPYFAEYTYTRSVGPVVGRFFAGLRDRRIEGVRARDGRVVVPPVDDVDDPEWVEVADTGVVTTWAWVDNPRRDQPLDKPFAWALVKLDGADTGMLHVVDAGDASKMSTGMKVRVRWRDERAGDIFDIECFEPAQ